MIRKILLTIICLYFIIGLGGPHYYAKISNYWPPLGGTNCSDFRNGECVSKSASGESWQMWINYGCACPKQFKFGTKFTIDGKEWVCIDRGGAIIMLRKGMFWLDLLTPDMDYKYGDFVEVKIK